jgi:vitamin B12 transporter
MIGFRQKMVGFIFLLICVMGNLLGQTSITDSVFALRPVSVVAASGWVADGTDKLLRLDSTHRLGFRQQQLADLLSGATPIAIKQYGAAGIGTSSIRGGNAAQTSVQWQGFPINNAMLAQADLSLIPMALVDGVTLQYGNGSALWGSGAVGGVLSLESRPAFSPRLAWEAGFGAGQFGQGQASLRLDHSTRAIHTQVRFVHQSARNDFTYRDIFGESQTHGHANTQLTGGVVNQFFRAGKHHWSWHAWWQTSDKEIPPTRVQERSVATQADQHLRTAVRYAYVEDNWQLRLRAARFQDRIAYRDALLDLSTNNEATQYWVEAQGRYQWPKGASLEMAIQVNDQSGASESYQGVNTNRRVVAGVARLTQPVFADWLLSLRLRQAWSDQGRLPIIPYVGVSGPLGDRWRLRANIHRSYRLPGLNDLFWNPGGNPDLHPESGWGQEVGVDWTPLEQTPDFSYHITTFNRQISNWIQWVPGPGYWAPQNVRTVWSRGVEQEINARLETSSTRWELRGYYHLIQSTDEEEGSDSEGLQLIYVPRHQAGGQITWRRGPWFTQYNHQWSSRRFTVADHQDHLEAFHRGDWHGGYTWDSGKLSAQLSLSLQNIWNTRYELVVNRPLPGRHWQARVIIEWHR